MFVANLKSRSARQRGGVKLVVPRAVCAVGGNQARLDARTEFEILEPSLKGGVEAGRAHHCTD